jgi:flavorubredoxin
MGSLMKRCRGKKSLLLISRSQVSGAGLLPVNTFVIKAQELVLVDAGMGIESEEFMKALEAIIDRHDLKWVWLTHDDADHAGIFRRFLRQHRVCANSWPYAG